MDQLTTTNLLITVGVIWIILQIYNTLSTAISNYKKHQTEENKPVNELLGMREECLKKFRHDLDRIETLEQETNRLKQGQRELLVGVRALLAHAIHNGNTEELQRSSDSIDKWLIDK